MLPWPPRARSQVVDAPAPGPCPESLVSSSRSPDGGSAALPRSPTEESCRSCRQSVNNNNTFEQQHLLTSWITTPGTSQSKPQILKLFLWILQLISTWGKLSFNSWSYQIQGDIGILIPAERNLNCKCCPVSLLIVMTCCSQLEKDVHIFVCAKRHMCIKTSDPKLYIILAPSWSFSTDQAHAVTLIAVSQ